jgi:hypothetical protein
MTASQDFESITEDKQVEFKQWILRQYFNNPDKIWYNSTITQNNILEYISSIKTFPQSAHNLVNLWKLKEGLKRHSKSKSEELPSVKETKYTVGDETLKNIGKEIGHVTPTMVTKFHDSAVGKLKFALHNKSIDEMGAEELDSLNEKIKLARIEAAMDYSNILIKNRGMIKNIIQELIDNHFITKNEEVLITEKEIIEIISLSNKPSETIRMTLYRDIERDNNIFKTYQSVVSKKFYKNKRFV